VDITYTEAMTATGALSLAACGLSLWAVAEIRHTRRELRRLIERDSARGIARMADELREGYDTVRRATAGMEALAVHVAEAGGSLQAAPAEPRR